jgi:hypothetical protein
MVSLRAHIHQIPPAVVKNARTRAKTMARLKREGAAEGADAIAGVWLPFIAGLPIGLLKILLNRRKLGALAHPFCSCNDGVLTSLIVLPPAR